MLNNHVACVQALVEVPEESGGGIQVLKVGYSGRGEWAGTGQAAGGWAGENRIGVGECAVVQVVERRQCGASVEVTVGRAEQ